MNKYSPEFREEVVRKKLSGRAVSEISEETGVSDVTIYQWAKDFKNGKQHSDLGPTPLKLGREKRLAMFFEYQTISSGNQGEWLRKNGVHSEHLEAWKKEFELSLNKESKLKEEIKRLKEALKLSERELKKKEKALAEAAALLVLKKKYLHLWEEEEK